MKLKDLAWVFTLSLLGLTYVVYELLAKILIQYGGLLAICLVALVALAFKVIITIL